MSENPFTKPWVLGAALLAIVLLAVTAFMTTRATANVTSAANATAAGVTATVPPPALPTATATATIPPPPTATRTSPPTATSTTTPTATPETTVKVFADAVNMRNGPGVVYERTHRLDFGEEVTLVGRSDDNAWLYIRTAGGDLGWIKSTLINLTGVSVDTQPIQTPQPTPLTTLKVLGDSVNLRAGPGTNYDKLQLLEFGAPMVLTGRVVNNSWLYVQAPDGQMGWVESSWLNLGGINVDRHPIQTPPPTVMPTPYALPDAKGRWINIDLSDQRLYAFEDQTLVATFLVSTGVDQYPTETGKFHIDVKLPFSDMRGSDYFLPDVPFTMYYYEDYAIHGTYWHHSFGTRMSHGCVNMDISDAEWLYNWASVGTMIYIHY